MYPSNSINAPGRPIPPSSSEPTTTSSGSSFARPSGDMPASRLATWSSMPMSRLSVPVEQHSSLNDCVKNWASTRRTPGIFRASSAYFRSI
jgi:hypothetical protein